MKAEVKWFEGVRTSHSFGLIILAHRHLEWVEPREKVLVPFFRSRSLTFP